MYQEVAPLPPERRPAWFWIAIAGGCFAVIIPMVFILLAVVAVPSMMRVRKAANQTSAIQSLRTIGSAEVIYSSTHPDEGFACSLHSLSDIDPALASTGYRSGYVFSVIDCTTKTVNKHTTFTGYRIAAIPRMVGRTGNVGYCIDENNVITVDPTGKWDCSEPLQ